MSREYSSSGHIYIKYHIHPNHGELSPVTTRALYPSNLYLCLLKEANRTIIFRCGLYTIVLRTVQLIISGINNRSSSPFAETRRAIEIFFSNKPIFSAFDRLCKSLATLQDYLNEFKNGVLRASIIAPLIINYV